MKIFIKLSIILISVCGIVSCTPKMTRDLWNGVYSQRAAVKEYDKKRDEFYAKETPEQKELRKKNTETCLSWINKKYPNPNFDYDLSHKKQLLYESCMKEKGTPVY